MSGYKKLTLNSSDFPKYESPIQVLFDEPLNPLITAMEDSVVAEVSQTLHIKIDKDELTKALAYDRGQYEKGYRDALDAVQVVRCKECNYGITGHGITDGWVLCSKPYATDAVGGAMHRCDWFCADALKVVRCEKCKHWIRNEDYSYVGRCELWNVDFENDFYCADGERKDDENN